ncbi:MAG: tyrosine-type recombinase/integrase [Oscillospiraceae bacterium]
MGYFEEYKKKVKATADDYIFAFDCKTLILHLNSEHAGTTIEIKVTPHQLRHAYATMLYKSGVDMLTAQYLGGHADINTTLSIYTHLDNELKIKSVGSLNAYLDNKKCKSDASRM